MKLKKLICAVLSLVMVLALCACGQKAAPAPDAEKSEDTAATAESDLAYLKEQGKMIIGYTVYEPMNYTDKEGNFTGFDTELATAVCEKLGITPEFVEINWDTKEVELNAKSIDCIWNGLTIDEERQATMALTNPYVQNAQVVVTKADAEYKDTSSLVGKTVVAEVGSAGEKTIKADKNLAQSEFVGKSVQTDCLMEVKAGTADAAVLDLTLANSMIGEGTDYADLAIRERLAVEEYGVAFRKGSDVAAAVNQAFVDLTKDGTMATLAGKYGLDLAK